MVEGDEHIVKFYRRSLVGGLRMLRAEEEYEKFEAVRYHVIDQLFSMKESLKDKTLVDEAEDVNKMKSELLCLINERNMENLYGSKQVREVAA